MFTISDPSRNRAIDSHCDYRRRALSPRAAKSATRSVRCLSSKHTYRHVIAGLGLIRSRHRLPRNGPQTVSVSQHPCPTMAEWVLGFPHRVDRLGHVAHDVEAVLQYV